MKEAFKDLQKAHMKRVKSETAPSASSGSASQPQDKRFVTQCLVRVELEQEWTESHREELKVSTEIWYSYLR